MTAFHTNFAALVANRHGNHDANAPVTLHTDGHDTVLEFMGGSVRIEGVLHLHAQDFLF